MKQSDIDRVVEITRVETPGIGKEIHSLKKKLDVLRQERESLEKQMVGKASKDTPIVIWETSTGVLVEARHRGSVTIIDKVKANG